jgi:hypothetical protein
MDALEIQNFAHMSMTVYRGDLEKVNLTQLESITLKSAAEIRRGWLQNAFSC